jgi:hypothetical protein
MKMNTAGTPRQDADGSAPSMKLAVSPHVVRLVTGYQYGTAERLRILREDYACLCRIAPKLRPAKLAEYASNLAQLEADALRAMYTETLAEMSGRWAA